MLQYLCWEEPEVEVAVVFLVDSEVSSITLDIGSRQRSHKTQLPGWNKTSQTINVCFYPSVSYDASNIAGLAIDSQFCNSIL